MVNNNYLNKRETHIRYSFLSFTSSLLATFETSGQREALLVMIHPLMIFR